MPSHPSFSHDIDPEPQDTGSPGPVCCSECGREYNSHSDFLWEGEPICRSCIRRYKAVDNTNEREMAEPPALLRPISLFSPRLILLILFRPVRFFSSMRIGGGQGEPLLFAFFWLTLLLTLAIPARYFEFRFAAFVNDKAIEMGIDFPLLPGNNRKELSGNETELEPEETPINGSQQPDEKSRRNLIVESFARRNLDLYNVFGMGLWMLEQIPAEMVFILLFTFVQALWQHLLVRFFGHRTPFEASLRIAFFALSAVAFRILPIPILAGLATMVYEIVLCIIGFRQVFRLPILQAITVGALPPLFFLVIQNAIVFSAHP